MFVEKMARASIAAALQLGGVLVLLGLACSHVRAQTLSVLASFDRSNGGHPWGSLTLIGNTLYGAGQYGGNLSLNNGWGLGTVYSLPVGGGNPTVLASFNGSNGAVPVCGLTLSGDTLYGTTVYGGSNGSGTVFSVPVSGGNPTVLASVNGSNGAMPCAGLTLGGNTLYGTTDHGGAKGCGAVFSLPVSGGNPTVLASFNGSNGQYPEAGLTLGGNTLYGTAMFGGANSIGTVFALTIPEPSSLALLGAGALGIIAYAWRKRRTV